MMKLYIPGQDPSELVRKVERDFPGMKIKIDKELAFYDYLTSKIESREEICTVRFRLNTIRIPGGANGIVDWIETNPKDENYHKQLGTIRIPLVVVADLRSFPEGLALLDEYSSKKEMIKDIQKIYNSKLKPEDILSAYMLGELKKIN